MQWGGVSRRAPILFTVKSISGDGARGIKILRCVCEAGGPMPVEMVHSTSEKMKMTTDSTLPPLPPKVGGTRLFFQNKRNRDAHFRKLERNGIVAKRGSVEDEMIHPDYVIDFYEENRGAFVYGRSDKPCFFSILYTLDF
jgi:hypothetical protein